MSKERVDCIPSVIPQFLKTYWSTPRASSGAEATGTSKHSLWGTNSSSTTVWGHSEVTLFTTSQKNIAQWDIFIGQPLALRKMHTDFKWFCICICEKCLQWGILSIKVLTRGCRGTKPECSLLSPVQMEAPSDWQLNAQPRQTCSY